MGNTNTPPRLYALTPIDQAEGLEDGYYRLVWSDGTQTGNTYPFRSGEWKVAYAHLSQFTNYLRPLPAGMVAVSEDIMSYEALQPIVEQIAYQMLSGDQMGDLVAKMDILIKFIQTKLAQQGK